MPTDRQDAWPTKKTRKPVDPAPSLLHAEGHAVEEVVSRQGGDAHVEENALEDGAGNELPQQTKSAQERGNGNVVAVQGFLAWPSWRNKQDAFGASLRLTRFGVSFKTRALSNRARIHASPLNSNMEDQSRCRTGAMNRAQPMSTWILPGSTDSPLQRGCWRT